MTRTYDLDRHTDFREVSADDLPQEKLEKAVACAAIKPVICDECGAETYLVGMAGHNGQDECHECGERYKVVG